jgi:hypothetical protein
VVTARSRWVHAGWDALAFAGGLLLAWHAGWNTSDLVWSLWLSSLVVGYASIVWTLSSSARELGSSVARDPFRGYSWVGPALVVGGGTLFGLAFFTVHFGGFHFVHSVFLMIFFPLFPNATPSPGFGNWAAYTEVFHRYWMFLPVAFLAERACFASTSERAEVDPSVSAAAIERRKQKRGQLDMMSPYRNVIRMHLLIFFFAGAHFAHLENFYVYAVVYAVYFFPWRLVRTDSTEAAAKN